MPALTIDPATTNPAQRIARLLALVLLGLGVGAGLAAMIWIFAVRGSFPSQAELAARSALGRGLWVFAHASIAPTVAVGLGLAAVAAGFLLWQGRTRRWPLAAIAISAVVALGGVWFLQVAVSDAEPPRYRSRSPYVRAATDLAYAGTIYFGALAAAAAAAYFLTRRTAGPVAGAPGASAAMPPG